VSAAGLYRSASQPASGIVTPTASGVGQHPEAGLHRRVAHQVLEEDRKQEDAAEQPDGAKDGQQDAQV
jgi:hypothetical protein